MPKTKNQKQAILENVKNKLATMKSAVFVNFSGIPVKEIGNLREKCKEENAEYLVAKKSLLNKVLSENGLESVKDTDLTGEVATIFGYGDEVAPAKLVKDFIKTNDKMKIVGGILEGEYIDQEKVVFLSKLPSRPELLAKAVGSLAAPLSGLVNVLQGNIRGLVYVLSAIKNNK